MAISKRLQTIADFVPKGAKLADIGTDHGYLPLYLLEKNQVARAMLCDINEAPLALAKKNAALSGIDSALYAIRLGNGLEACLDDDIDTVSISGMGANLIMTILLAKPEKLKKIDSLVLSPNVAPWLIREELPKQGFYLNDEALVYENGHYYEILFFTREERAPLSEAEIYFGRHLKENPLSEPYFLERRKQDFSKMEKMALAKNQESVKQEINRIKALWENWDNG